VKAQPDCSGALDLQSYPSKVTLANKPSKPSFQTFKSAIPSLMPQRGAMKRSSHLISSHLLSSQHVLEPKLTATAPCSRGQRTQCLFANFFPQKYTTPAPSNSHFVDCPREDDDDDGGMHVPYPSTSRRQFLRGWTSCSHQRKPCQHSTPLPSFPSSHQHLINPTTKEIV